MSENLYIEKKPNLPLAMDYQYLRNAGLQYIQDLAKELWTDYNPHDPGITQLEILCYAITELGYRCNLPIKNLLTQNSGKIDNGTFHTAADIMTNAALTELDYRKILLDIEGINNAWIVYSSILDGENIPLNNEIPIYINELEDCLSLLPKDKKGNNLDVLQLRGLNKVVLELGNNPTLGDLNDVSVTLSAYNGTKFLEAQITLDFNDWNDGRTNWFQRMDKPNKIKFLTAEIIPNEKRVTIHVQHTIDATKKLTFYAYPKDVNELNAVKDFLDLEQNFCYHITQPLRDKKNKIKSIYQTEHQKLNDNRNLTEDWLCLETINKTNIGICAKIFFKPNADISETLSRVYLAIEEIINPKIRFYTLKEMLNKGISTPEIFHGPKLEHGFLMDEEVQKAKLPNCLHASDFISAIMQIDGIADVKELMLTAYDASGKAIIGSKNEKWCLHLDGKTKPFFDIYSSKILLYKEQIPFFLSEQIQSEISQKLTYANMENDLSKLKNMSIDLDVPNGNYLQLNDYLSIQEEFPATYKIGKDQMSKTALPKRKAQAKQLKAYLLHYDQLLADFFNQLFHAKDLLDIKPDCETNERSYFPTYLKDIPGVEFADISSELYENNFLNAIMQTDYANQVSLYESQTEFYARKNRFLDHLLARFAVSFNDYAAMMYQMQQNARGIAELKIQDAELIEDKKQFLKDLPELSSNRGLAFNYLQQPEEDIWDKAVQSGFQKRISRLLGINNTNLSNLTLYDNTPQTHWHYDTNIGVLSFMMLNDSSLSLQDKWTVVHRLINDVSAYDIRKTSSGFWIDIINEDKKRIAKYNQKFGTYKKAFEKIPKIYQAINSTLENMYCIEHILLRPMLPINEADKAELNKHLLQVCLKDDCYSPANADPYSFKITIVLRGDLARFRNPYFREYAERLIRKEAPAHVLVKICWISKEEMTSFQKAYKTWIEKYRELKTAFCTGTKTSLQNSYNQALKQLILALQDLNTIYDEGTLYNCQLGESQNPIVLTKTSLGTL